MLRDFLNLGSVRGTEKRRNSIRNPSNLVPGQTRQSAKLRGWGEKDNAKKIFIYLAPSLLMPESLEVIIPRGQAFSL